MKTLLLSALTILLATPALAQKAPTMRSAESLLRREKWEQAAEAFAAIAAGEPENALAWYQLGYARANLGQFELAIVADRRAARSGAYEASALYNVACCLAQLGRLEEARSALAEAMAAGFLNIDLLETDTDLEALRAEQALDLPARHAHTELRARNGRTVAYSVVEPEGYDPERSYPVLVAFPPGDGPRSADWALEHLWTPDTKKSGWVIVVPVAPADGWMNHPAHHALEDLLKRLEKRYHVKHGELHLTGFAYGSRVALNYSQMSRPYFQSLSLVGCRAWSRWDEGDLAKLARRPLTLVVGEQDTYSLSESRRVETLVKGKGGQVRLHTVAGAGRLVPPLRGAALLEALAPAPGESR